MERNVLTLFEDTHIEFRGKKSGDEKKKNTKSSRIFVTAWRRLISPTGWLNDIEMRSCSAPKIQLSTRLVSKFCNFRWIFFMFAQLYLLNHSEIRQRFSMNNVFFISFSFFFSFVRLSSKSLDHNVNHFRRFKTAKLNTLRRFVAFRTAF